MSVHWKEIRLELTCSACPEQYDATYSGQQVGYLRLRHGNFTVECPDVGGKLVYEAQPEGDGIFEDEERDYYLSAAKMKIADWCNAQGIEPELNTDE